MELNVSGTKVILIAKNVNKKGSPHVLIATITFHMTPDHHTTRFSFLKKVGDVNFLFFFNFLGWFFFYIFRLQSLRLAIFYVAKMKSSDFLRNREQHNFKLVEL